jgi:hypothetical protein
VEALGSFAGLDDLIAKHPVALVTEVVGEWIKAQRQIQRG